jgi:hypothetical protein
MTPQAGVDKSSNFKVYFVSEARIIRIILDQQLSGWFAPGGNYSDSKFQTTKRPFRKIFLSSLEQHSQKEERGTVL